MWIDTHCHLDAGEFAADRAAVLAEAQAAGVDRIVIPAVEVGNFAPVRALVLQNPGLAAAYGIHPLFTPRAGESDLAELRVWLRDERPLAVGEIGLDGFVPGLDMARQEWFFVEQLKLARDFDLPVLLHLRRAQDLVLKHLRRVFGTSGGRAGIAHAFNGSRQQADEFLKLGFKLGFGGSVTYDGSTRIRKLAAELPPEAIVLETDAPDIPPAWIDRQRNSPAELPRIGEVVANLRGATTVAVAAFTSDNARAGLPGLTRLGE
jgi:TatD DNase family protein